VERAPRTGRHPLTEKTIKSPGKKVIKFKAGIEIAGWTW
jgi:nucleoid DNA-binding protein